jgi:hypothetical protein
MVRRCTVCLSRETLALTCWKQIVQVETKLDYGGVAEIAMVLKADKDREGTYRRIGLIQVPKSKMWFRGADVVKVTIV